MNHDKPSWIMKYHGDPPGTMKNQPGALKNHENPPGTKKNQPGTMKTMKTREKP